MYTCIFQIFTETPWFIGINPIFKHVKFDCWKNYSAFFLTGPFRQCDDYVDPTDQYESCLYDACVLGSDSEAICSAFEQYAQVCQRYGQSVHDWRSTLNQCSEYRFSLLLHKTSSFVIWFDGEQVLYLGIHQSIFICTMTVSVTMILILLV